MPTERTRRCTQSARNAFPVAVTTTLPSTPAVLRPALSSLTRRTLNSALARERSISFCRSRTLSRSPAFDAVKILRRSRLTSCSTCCQSTDSQSRSPPSGPFTTTSPRCLTCPSVLGLRCHRVLTGPPDHVSTLSGPGTSPYPASYTRRPAEAPTMMSRFPVAVRLPAFASWSSFPRRGTGPSSRSAYRTPKTGSDLDGIVTFRTHETRPGRVPSIPRGLRCPHDRKASPTATRRITTAKSLNPGPTTTTRRLLSRGINQGFTRIHPSGLPLTCGPRVEREPLGFSPSFTPRRYQRRMSAWGQAPGTT